jgi:hypothetical protein
MFRVHPTTVPLSRTESSLTGLLQKRHGPEPSCSHTIRPQWRQLFTNLCLLAWQSQGWRPEIKKWLTVTSLYILEVMCYIKRHKVDLSQNINIHKHNTRPNRDYHVKYCRMSFFLKSVINRGIELFNKLPNNIKNMEHFPTFRKELRSFLLSNVFLYNKWI